MKKLALIISLLLVPCICIAAGEAKKEVKKEPVKKGAVEPAKEQVKEVKSADIVVDGFEGEKAKWKGLAFISGKDGGQEETAEDKIKLDIEKDAKFVKSGKQSMKVQYTMKNPSANKFAQLGYTSDKPMGGNNAVSFWINNKAKGKASLTVTLFDNIDWNKRISQPVQLNFEGWKLVTLSAADFTTAPGWDKVIVVQVIVKGDALFYLDDLKFTKVKADK